MLQGNSSEAERGRYFAGLAVGATFSGVAQTAAVGTGAIVRAAIGLGSLLDSIGAPATEPVGGATNVATKPQLVRQLLAEEASVPFAPNGTLTAAAVRSSREIKTPEQIGNPAVPPGFAKYSTPTHRSPSGDFQVHFYRNPTTGQVWYTLDYKVVFNR
jgi:hypothetical protein